MYLTRANCDSSSSYAQSLNAKGCESFAKTMISVVFCAVLLYIILIFVKKYYGSAFAPPADDEDYDNLELTTPDDKTEALRSFLNRTRL